MGGFVAGLARQVWPSIPDQRLLLDVGDGIEAGGRSVRPDRFRVPEDYRQKVNGRSVLLVDDTWTTGSKSQSAALALRAAGARAISILCVARWCRDDWPDHRALLDRFWAPYDPAVCPVSGVVCRAAVGQR